MSAKKLNEIELIEDRSDPNWDQGRVARIQRFRVRNLYKDGTQSKVYNVDVTSHYNHDAVAVVPYWYENDEVWVMLLRSFRPALTFRDIQPEQNPFLIEAVAGVIEDNEHSAKGAKKRAVAESLEEVGLVISENDVKILGEPIYVSPGIYTEKLWLCTALADLSNKVEPTLDGSVMEEMISPLPMTLIEALKKCETGEIKDAKTEISLWRLARKLQKGH